MNLAWFLGLLIATVSTARADDRHCHGESPVVRLRAVGATEDAVHKAIRIPDVGAAAG